MMSRFPSLDEQKEKESKRREKGEADIKESGNWCLRAD